MTTNITYPVESATETATAVAKPAKKKTVSRNAAAKSGSTVTRSKGSKAKQATKPRACHRTKQSKLADMLRRKDGATISQIMKAFSWQPHTARAAISGLKKRGERVESAIENSKRVYRITADKAAS